MLNIRTLFSNKTKMLLSLLAISSLTACNGLFSIYFGDSGGQEDVVCEEDTTEVTFKQVAYWIEDDPNDFEDIDDDDNDIDYTQLTHLVFGYIEANADGTLDLNSDGTLADITDDDGFQDAIDDLQSEGVKVFISIDGDSHLKTIAGDDDLIGDFVDNVIDLVDAYELDGIDLSWQFPDTDDEGELFEDLVKALSDELWDADILFTIEVVSGLDDNEDVADVISSDVFDYVDFVNIKAFVTDDYDDLHLSTGDLLDVISYWTDRCLIQNKLVVGIPVYATGDNATSYSYADVIDEKNDKSIYACDSDDRVSIGGDYYYFNAIPTVVEKTANAQTYAGGVILMSLAQDYNEDSDYSLLNAINNELEGYDSVCD